MLLSMGRASALARAGHCLLLGNYAPYCARMSSFSKDRSLIIATQDGRNGKYLIHLGCSNRIGRVIIIAFRRFSNSLKLLMSSPQ
jgi:hypothetical protein